MLYFHTFVEQISNALLIASLQIEIDLAYLAGLNLAQIASRYGDALAAIRKVRVII